MQAEVLYGILGSSTRMADPEAAVEVIRVYNDFLAEFCDTHPERFAGPRLHPERAHRGGRCPR